MGIESQSRWQASDAMLVCIGPGPRADRLVRTASRRALRSGAPWHAVYIETHTLQRLPESQRRAILVTLKLADSLGGVSATLSGQNEATVAVAYAREHRLGTVVIGRSSPRLGWRRIGPKPFVRQVAELAPDLELLLIARDPGGPATPKTRLLEGEHAVNVWPGCGWAVASSAAVSLIATPMRGWFDLANIVMLFMLAVVLVAVKFGRIPALLAATVNVLAFDFFFVPPRFSFAVSDVQYLLTFAVMLVVGLLTGQLTAGLRFEARISSSRERRAQSLFELTRDLSAALLDTQVAELGVAALQRNFGGQAVVLVTDGNDQLAVPVNPPAGFDSSVADWAFRNEQPAGLATSTLSAQTWHYVPLKAPMRVRGVLALTPAQPRWLLIPEQQQQLDTLARQIAIALERVHYVEIAQQAVVEIESERLRNTLLAAISHDVRTPLTALIGLAESLQRSLRSPPGVGQGGAPGLAHTETQADCAAAITQQARQLGTLVTNLLDMARLQNDGVKLRSEWQSVQEVVGSAIRAAQHALGTDRVTTDVPADLPLVEFDAVLMERVLVNLLENAAKYGATPIVVSARTTTDTLVLSVRDHGPGLPAALKGREAELFDKFTRGEPESATPGVGLGLAICKAVVDAHRGKIVAHNTLDGTGGGAEFQVILPRRAPPVLEQP